MLVLSRKPREVVVVGGSERVLRVTVLEIIGRNVRLGFEADAEIPVYRSEVWERIYGGTRANGPGPRPPLDGA